MLKKDRRCLKNYLVDSYSFWFLKNTCLNGGDDLSVPLSRVASAGGKILMEKTSIRPNGFMAHFVDREGNKVAFHSMG